MGNIPYPGCVGRGTYLNISEAGECDSSSWTQSPHTDIVVIHWSLLLKFSTARMLLRVSLSLLQVFFFFFFLLSACRRSFSVLEYNSALFFAH